MRLAAARPRLIAAGVLTALVVAAAPAAGQSTTAGSEDPFMGTGVWIWHVANTEQGNLPAIAARATAAQVKTVIIKAAHGPNAWPQFSGPTIATLKAYGLRVCAYQRLLGRRPAAEAAAAAQAVRAGADCFVIDAEAELEGRYRQARAYMRALRAAVGADYPIALTSFPYADLHQRFPYSVFLGPGGAQVNIPQIYWRALRVPVGAAFARTYRFARLYARPIRPLGQLWMGPPAAQVLAFRQIALNYGAEGMSWWNWEQSRPGLWPTLNVPVFAGIRATPGYPTLRRGARGDAVLWAKSQMRRLGVFPPAGATFDAALQRELAILQAEAGLPPTGLLDPPTWSYLLSDLTV